MSSSHKDNNLSQEDRYEITVDDSEYLNTDATIEKDELTTRLKSEATRRKGRGFSSASGTSSFYDDERKYDQLVDTEYSGHAQRSIEGWTLFLTGLHEECTEDDLLDLLSEWGTVRGLKMSLDHRTGYVKGYAVVEYGQYEEARRAQENLNGMIFMEGTLKAEFAFVKPPSFTH